MDTIGENVLLKEHARNAEIGIFIVTARLKSELWSKVVYESLRGGVS